MKKQIAIAMGLAVLSTPALATKARLEALGQSANGSQFIEDNRNVFLNPATINYHKDFVTYEWGSTQTASTATTQVAIADDTTVSTDLDTAASPKSEGGFFKASGNMAYGLYLGRESNTSNSLRGAAGVFSSFTAPSTPGSTTDGEASVLGEQNNIDLFIGGDAGIQWGANLLYHSFKDKQAGDLSSEAMRLTVGVISGDVEGFANIGISNTAESDVTGSDAEFEGNGSYDVGVSYDMADVTYIGRVQGINAEDVDSDEVKINNWSVGAAKEYTLNDRSTVWVSGFYNSDSRECDTGMAAACGGAEEKKDQYVPVSVAMEVGVKEWLALRGSVSQNIWGVTDNGDDEKTIENTTSVAGGASIMWGDFQVDGLIGNYSGSSDAVTSTDTAGGQGTLRSDALLSRVSFLYKF